MQNICQGATFPHELSSGRESKQKGWSPVPGTTEHRCTSMGVLGRACACPSQEVWYGKAGIKEAKKREICMCGTNHTSPVLAS